MNQLDFLPRGRAGKEKREAPPPPPVYCGISKARGSSEAEEQNVELEFRGRVIVLVARVEVPR
jgi:hypothetical protein